MSTKVVKISDIKIGKRYRSKLGDLSSLQESISKHGLLQPIGIGADNVLIFGQRRLEVHKKLGLKEIEVKVFDLDDLEALQIEQSENDDRDPMDDDDKLDLSKAIRAKIKERRGNPELKVFDQNTQEPASSSNVRQLAHIGDQPKKGERTEEHVAKSAGFKNAKEMERKEKVKEKAPAPVWEAVKAEVVSVSDAAAIADEPAEKQLEALERVKSGQAKTLKAGLAEPKQSAKSKAAIRAALKHEAPSEDSEPVLDPNKRVIPAVLSQVVADSEAFSEFTRHLAELIKLIKEARVDGYRSAHLPLSALNDAENLKLALQSNTFYCVCVHCEGKQQTDKCPACHGAGWLNKILFERAPREKKKVS
jgi:hypothetical protein